MQYNGRGNVTVVRQSLCIFKFNHLDIAERRWNRDALERQRDRKPASVTDDALFAPNQPSTPRDTCLARR